MLVYFEQSRTRVTPIGAFVLYLKPEVRVHNVKVLQMVLVSERG